MVSKMRWQEIEGWFSQYDVDFVVAVCEGIHEGIVVELGCYAGKSTAAMAPVCKKNVNNYCVIDNFWGTDPKDPATRNQRKRNMREVFENNMRAMNILDYLEIHKLDSAASSQLFVDGEVDFCFIDASHAKEDVRRDVDAWWPKIKVGGTLGGHDYQWQEVREVVNAFVKTNQLKLVLGKDKQCWKVVKKEQK